MKKKKNNSWWNAIVGGFPFMKWSIFQQGNGILGVVSGRSALGGPREKRNPNVLIAAAKKLPRGSFIRITLILRAQKIKYYGWWTWKTLHFENRSFHQDRPQKFRLKYVNIAPKRAPRGKCLKILQTFPAMWTYFHVLEMNIFLISSPSARSAETFFKML